MAQSLTHTLRQMSRSQMTAEEASKAPPTEHVAVKAIAPDLAAHYAAIVAANAAVAAAEKASGKEVRESLGAMEPLAKVFDELRLLGEKLGTLYPAASQFRTPDDLIHAAEQLESDLELKKEEQWAAAGLAALGPVVDNAIKESTEANAALKALQKAQTARDQALGVARPVFVNFRRAVRASFGRSSRQYRELLDRRGGPEEDEDPNAPVPPAPTGPTGPTPIVTPPR